ncbi:MAG TPA: M55 family metallopeptidase [Clostridiaceae bacterium]
MKLFISADIEGTTGIVNWEETDINKAASNYFCEQMTKEVKSACEAAIEAGADDIVVKDAHDSGRNIDPSKLPSKVRIIRGWTGGPLSMMDGLDSSFDGVILTGYHSAASTCGNPLAHTMNTRNEYVLINDEIASEFLINCFTAALFRVPVLFLSGDKLLCETAKELNENIKVVEVSEGMGGASISINPTLALERIKKEVFDAVKDDYLKYMIKLPEKFKVEIRFRDHSNAYRASFYPGAKQSDIKIVQFEASNYMDVLNFLNFVL